MELESSDEEAVFITPNTISQHSSSIFNLQLHDFLFDNANCLEVEANIGEKNNELEIQEPKRDIAVVSDVDLHRRVEATIPHGTKCATAWCVQTWKEWAEERSKLCSTSVSDKYQVVDLDILQLSKEELDYWLAKFVLEVRKKKTPGECYPPNTLYQICCGIQRFLKENGKQEFKLFTDTSFKLFQDALDSEMKRLTSKGVGVQIKQAEAFSEEQEEKLWSSHVLGSHSPKVLLDTMVFLIGKNFSLRSGKEHRSLSFSQLSLVPPKNGEPEKLVYTSYGEKNNAGGLKHRSFKGKRVEHYANEERPERCLSDKVLNNNDSYSENPNASQYK
ncbi:zinc finger MYM-type protein 3-like [Actinia tenebrosa]|uniref:Zinc finger MYM-type protein 3-like n=1 Tax=Actinia tenebrosa TaxID=6105 RepID=A0A6P8GYU8_ACTTE|nr:zinc finger MYM-type protein 3-like [Actinia tenebrosa]